MKFRPRFTVRTLAILVTLVCAYFGAWEATKRYGVNNIKDWRWFIGNELNVEGPLARRFFTEHSPAPFIIFGDYSDVRRYYLWLFGARYELPFTYTAQLN